MASFSKLDIKNTPKEQIEAALEAWLKENAGIIRCYAIRANITSMDLDDVIQNLNIACWHAAEKYDPQREATFTTYAIEAMRKCIFGMHRAENTKKRELERTASSIDDVTSEGRPMQEVIVMPCPNPEDVVIGMDVEQVVERVLAIMSERNRSIVKCLIAGHKQSDVGKVFGLTQPCISAIHNEFRQILREELKKEGYIE